MHHWYLFSTMLSFFLRQRCKVVRSSLAIQTMVSLSFALMWRSSASFALQQHLLNIEHAVSFSRVEICYVTLMGGTCFPIILLDFLCMVNRPSAPCHHFRGLRSWLTLRMLHLQMIWQTRLDVRILDSVQVCPRRIVAENLGKQKMNTYTYQRQLVMPLTFSKQKLFSSSQLKIGFLLMVFFQLEEEVNGPRELNLVNKVMDTAIN